MLTVCYLGQSAGAVLISEASGWAVLSELHRAGLKIEAS